MIKKEKRMEILKNRIVEVLVQSGGIAHLTQIYNELNGFKQFYKSKKSFRGTIRGLMQSYSSEYIKVFNGSDVFSNLEKRSGYWCLAQYRNIQGTYSSLRAYLSTHKSASICKECIKNYI